MKDTIDTQRVTNPVRQRLAASRKRTLRSRTVRSARSVWSEHQSRVIESRKFADGLGLPYCAKGDSIVQDDMAMTCATSPGSESRAKMYGGIRGTCESLPLPDQNSRNGMKPEEQRPGSRRVFSRCVVAKHRKESGYCCSRWSQEQQDGEIAGRLSRLIVAIESWETLLGGSQ
jgi:hypothetical protein